jgi:transcriptional regulator GlxA family with amidase domain
MTEGDPMATRERQTIAFVLYPGITLLDMVGPLQVFSVLQSFNDQYQPVVVAERIEPMPTDTPLTVTADKTLAEVPDPMVVIVPGGGAPAIKAMGNEALRDYLRRAAETSQVVGSVCTGAMVLAAAGLLEGRDATTHWSHHRLLERLGARYLPQRWVEDGKVITSAGVSAGIDMALALVARLTDEPTARMVQLWIEYDPHPPFGGIDWDQVDRDMAEPVVDQWVQTQLADRPELLARLRG